jgi:mono/diheme cytochrome c family protein
MSGSIGEISHQGVTRLAVAMLLLALCAASVVAWLALNTPGTSFLVRRGDGLPGSVYAISANPVTPALIEQGADIVRAQCAGCHDPTHRLVGPSWTAIGKRYAAMAALDAICGDGRSLIGDGASHPAPAWDGYPPGPTNIGLSPDDRAAVAAWARARS